MPIEASFVKTVESEQHKINLHNSLRRAYQAKKLPTITTYPIQPVGGGGGPSVLRFATIGFGKAVGVDAERGVGSLAKHVVPAKYSNDP